MNHLTRINWKVFSESDGSRFERIVDLAQGGEVGWSQLGHQEQLVECLISILYSRAHAGYGGTRGRPSTHGEKWLKEPGAKVLLQNPD